MDRIQRAFEKFDAENPRVYEILVAMAREYAGDDVRVGIVHLFEVVRWRRYQELRTTAKLLQLTIDYRLAGRLNNNFRSRYARKIMAENADLAGFFSIRRLGARARAGE